MRELIRLADRLEFKISEHNEISANIIRDAGSDLYEKPFNEENKNLLVSLWEDKGIQDTWKKTSEFQIQMTNYFYLMENIDRISDSEYVPTFDDILRARQTTTGSQTLSFSDEERDWELVDVGGQLPERKKWSDIMGGALHGILYFASLDEYNIKSSEEEGTKMEISLKVWEEFANDDSRRGICLILFLNKVDIFKEKIQEKHHWKDFKKVLGYKGKRRDWESCADHIRSTFMEGVNQDDEEYKIMFFNSCALDSDGMKGIFEQLSNYVFLNKVSFIFN